MIRQRRLDFLHLSTELKNMRSNAILRLSAICQSQPILPRKKGRFLMGSKILRRDAVFQGVIFQIFGICILDAQIADQNRFLPEICLRAADFPVTGDFCRDFAFEPPIFQSRAILPEILPSSRRFACHGRFFFCYNRARR